MARYVDGFVICVPKNNIEAYRRLAERASAIWKEHGALDYWECVGDDLTVDPCIVSFPQLAQAKEDETVVFAWAVYESREARDRANAAIMVDERMKPMMEETKPVFDASRMAYGGFRVLVHS